MAQHPIEQAELELRKAAFAVQLEDEIQSIFSSFRRQVADTQALLAAEAVVIESMVAEVASRSGS